jgi:hypothetical protein
VRKLARKNASNIQSQPDLLITASTKIFADQIRAEQLKNVLHIPRSQTYQAVDCWIPSVGVLQITLTNDHDIKQASKLRKDMALIGVTKFLWLLPPTIYYSFTIKTPQTMDQYAVS